MYALSPRHKIDDVLSPYRAAERRGTGSRPWVLANMVSGLDGSIAVRGRVGALSGDADQRLFRLLRSLADFVLVGAATVRAERYGPVRLPESEQRARRERGSVAVPRLAIVSGSLDLDPDSALFTETDAASRPVVFTCQTSDTERRASLAEVAEMIVSGDASVELERALGLLKERGAEVVLCEGGAVLLGQLVERKLLDELCLTLSPVMGGDALPVAMSPLSSDLMRFRLAHVLASEDTLFLRYESGRENAERLR